MIFEVQNFDRKQDFLPRYSVDEYVLEQIPEFVDYLFYHSILDKFCWLIKLRYSPKETVKSKRYRLDELFQHFLIHNKITIEKAFRVVSKDFEVEKLEYHLTKGWYNELVRSDPVDETYLSIGTSLGKNNGPGSGGHIAWNIIQSYYAFYEFLSCFSVSVNPKLDTRGHKGVAKEFSNHIIGKTSNRLIFYPFTLTSTSNHKSFPQHSNHCRFEYATYPRESRKKITDIEREIPKAFTLLENSGKKSILDLMYSLRLWANYTGLQSLLKLTDGGYQQFLVKNLATVNFFAAGLAELATIAAIGEGSYISLLSQFTQDYVNKHERFSRSRTLLPLFVRLKIYKHLNLLSEEIDFILPSEPVSLIHI